MTWARHGARCRAQMEGPMASAWLLRSCHPVRVTNDSHHFISVANREIGAHENLNNEHPENLKE